MIWKIEAIAGSRSLEFETRLGFLLGPGSSEVEIVSKKVILGCCMIRCQCLLFDFHV